MRRFGVLLMLVLVLLALVVPAVAFGADAFDVLKVDQPISVTPIATLAAVIWAVTGILKKIKYLVDVDPSLIALVVGVVAAIGAVSTGYVQGGFYATCVTMVGALFGAGLLHDKIVAPTVDTFAGS